MIEKTIDISDWLAVFPDRKLHQGTVAAEEIEHLPMMTARRLTKGCRAAVEVAATLLKRTAVDSLIFVSRHGEVARSEKILTSIALSKPVSPTDFGMSVHNAASAVASIYTKFKGPVTSIVSGSDSLHSALIEALAQLGSDKKTVLLINFESALPDIIGPTLEENPALEPYAMGCVIKNGDAMRLTFTFNPRKDHTFNQISDLADFLSSSERSFSSFSRHSDLTWYRL